MDRIIIIEKIRKLKAVAENTCYQDEAMSANALATLLMKKHDVTEEEIEIWIDEVKEISAELEGALSEWEVNLVIAVAKTLNCVPIQRGLYFEDGIRKYELAFVGPKKDIDVAVRLFNWVRDEVASTAKKHKYRLNMFGALDLFSLMFGMSEAIYMKVRLKEQMTEKPKEEKKMEEAVDKYVNDKHQNMRGEKDEEKDLAKRLDSLSYRIGLDLGKYIELDTEMIRRQLVQK